MKTTSTFSVSFYPKTSKSKSEIALLYCRITYNGKRAEISLKRKFSLIIWDIQKSRAKGNSIEARQINLHITQISSELFEVYDELRKSHKPFSSQHIKAKFLGEDEERKSLVDLITYHTVISKDKHSIGTIKNYKATEGHLIAYLKKQYKSDDIFLVQLDYKFLSNLESYLRLYKPKDHQKPMGNNTVMKHIQRLRKMIKLALKLEWIYRDPFIRFEASYQKTNRTYLSENDLQAIEDKVFLIPRLNLVKDLFVFSCYTGLAYIDVVTLNPSDLSFGIDGNKWIKRPRTKGGTALQIPLLDKAEALIHKYHRDPRALNTGTLFPKLSNQKLNSYLKEIADLCGITSNLTFHVARHTFATTITLSNGVPIETVSKLLGHTKIATTQIYAKVVERKVSEDMNVLRSIINNKSVEHDQIKLKQVK